MPLDGNAISKILPNDEPVLPAIVEALREDLGEDWIVEVDLSRVLPA